MAFYWYPAKWGSDRCQPRVTYDLREHLPSSEQKKIPDSANPLQVCDCYRDLPIDDAHGPYPVITFIHGTAAFRTQSLTFATHWASRWFVVVSSDHPYIQLKDILTSFANAAKADEAGDAVKVLAALDEPTGDLAFLAGHLDMTRMAAIGHSAGGQAVAGLASRRSGIEVVIPMAAAGVNAGGDLRSSLVMSAADDAIASPSLGEVLHGRAREALFREEPRGRVEDLFDARPRAALSCDSHALTLAGSERHPRAIIGPRARRGRRRARNRRRAAPRCNERRPRVSRARPCCRR